MIRAHRLRGLTQIFFNSEKSENSEKGEKILENTIRANGHEWIGHTESSESTEILSSNANTFCDFGDFRVLYFRSRWFFWA